MSDTTQISAHIALTTKERLEQLVRATGVTRAHVIEQALLHHMTALEQLPAEAIVPARMVLDDASARRIAALVEHPPKPTDAMNQLFADRGRDGIGNDD